MTSFSQEHHRYKWLAFAAVSVGVFMSTLDASIVNIGLPTLTQAFNTDIPTVQWVVLAYLLAITSVLLSLGRLGDMIGRKKVYLIGIAIFTLGSVLCGASPSILALILSRALQGLGAAMIMAMGPAIITSSFPSQERGRALGLIGTVVAVGLTLGPALGGYIISYFGWRWMFFVNVPVGLIGAPLIDRILREKPVMSRERFDIPGAALLFVSLSCALLALSHGGEWGWTSVMTLMLSAGFAVSGAIFFWWETKASNPVFHLDLFRNRAFTSSAVSAWISYLSLFAVAVYMPFYLRQVLELTPVAAGHMLMLVPATVSFVAPLSGWLSDKFGPRILSSIGMAIITVGLVGLSNLGVDESLFSVAIWLLLAGMGSGIFQAPNSSAIMGSVPRDRLGVASGMVAMMRNFGMVSGVAIVGAVVSTQQIRFLAAADAVTLQASKAALVSGIHVGFLVAAAISVVGILVSASRENPNVRSA